MSTIVNLEICNKEFENFGEFVSVVYHEMMGAGCEVARQALEGLETELIKNGTEEDHGVRDGENPASKQLWVRWSISDRYM